MVQGRTPLTRRTLAVVLLGALALEGCASAMYPAAVHEKAQDTATAERDERECRERAVDKVELPLATGLEKTTLAALGGAALGAALVMGLTGANGSPGPTWFVLAVGAGAGLGFLIGSIAGTVLGAEDTAQAVRARREVFKDCMTERGYQLEP